CPQIYIFPISSYHFTRGFLVYLKPNSKKLHTMKKMFLLSALLLICASTTIAQKSKDEIIKNLDAQTQKYGDIAHEIWDLAEMGYLEEKSSALLQETLANEGFSIKKDIAGIPTAFVAEYGSGYPVIAILGEY